jgi:3-oxoacyl-(acyl-carrier-protein) synthase III
VYRPTRAVSNDEVCRTIDSTPDWIEARSGIVSRRFAGAEETLTAMAVAAGGKALANAGVPADRIDCVVVASMSNLVQTPPLAISVVDGLGLPNSAGFDVSAACAGFCHALATASDLVCTGQAEHVLVVGVERMTDIVDPADRSIAFLFADGAGAVVVGPGDRQGIGPAIRAADAESLAALRMNTSWGDFRADPSLDPPMMKMDGRRVFRWAVENVVPACRRALDAAGVTVADVRAFIPHQANLRMIEVLAERLGLAEDAVVARDVRDSGNTSSASIPLAMHRLLAQGEVGPGDVALLVGFGAGLNLAAQVVLLPGQRR